MVGSLCVRDKESTGSVFDRRLYYITMTHFMLLMLLKLNWLLLLFKNFLPSSILSDSSSFQARISKYLRIFINRSFFEFIRFSHNHLFICSFFNGKE